MERLSIYAPEFKEMLENLEMSFLHVAKKINGDEFESGDITLKLSVGTDIDFVEIPDGYGGVTSKPYKVPRFSFKTTTSLQKKTDVSGVYVASEKEMKDRDGVIYLIDVDSAQMKMEDI